jgi:hypothetical protein
MNPTMIPYPTSRYLIAVLFVLALTDICRAQQMDAGFLGKRYAGASLFIEHLNSGNISNGNGVELTGNAPLASFLDASLHASYEKFGDYSLKDQRFGGSLIGYADLDTWKPFAELGFTNTAQSSTVSGIKYTNSENLCSFGMGVEAPVSKSTSVFGVVAYNRYFNDKIDSYWTYKFGINTWVTPKLGAVLSVSIWDGESTTTSLGMVYRF